jgi:hypothetical protein
VRKMGNECYLLGMVDGNEIWCNLDGSFGWVEFNKEYRNSIIQLLENEEFKDIAELCVNLCKLANDCYKQPTGRIIKYLEDRKFEAGSIKTRLSEDIKGERLRTFFQYGIRSKGNLASQVRLKYDDVLFNLLGELPNW